MTYANPQLFIDGQWCDAADGKTMAIVNPATGQEIGRLAHAGIADLDRAVAAAQKGFDLWRKTPAVERSAIMRRAAAFSERLESNRDDASNKKRELLAEMVERSEIDNKHL